MVELYTLNCMVICMHIFIEFYLNKAVYWSFPGGTVVKNPPTNAGDTRDTGWIPGLGRSPSVGNGNALQYYCLGNPMDRGAWQAIIHGVAKESDTTKQLSTHTELFIKICKKLLK